MNNEIEYRGDWILINAYFYKFWMLRKEFNKYIITILYSTILDYPLFIN